MGVDPNVMDACKGLNLTDDYVTLYDVDLVYAMINLRKRYELDNIDLISSHYDEKYDVNYDLKITISNDEIIFEQCSVDYWKEVWRENINDIDMESFENIEYTLLAMQNGRL
jgi:hypothetical protein